MMVPEVPVTPVPEAIKAVAYALAVPPETLEGYVVIGIMGDGKYQTVANVRTVPYLAAVLSDVLSEATWKVAEDLDTVTAVT